ncbi:MAG: Crp/Fnr family transcriptional regulator [Deltaproteobacteria bacterium]|nr:Crp/Fnr family transcriptional regulator [Deltaproteobacteria bacterium]
MIINELLLNSQLFTGFSEANLGQLAAITTNKSYLKREVMFFEGEQGAFFCLLINGVVQISKMAPDGREIVIKIIQPGEMFGEVILFELNTYPVTATALADSELCIIPKDKFMALLDEQSFRNEFMRILIAKQRYLAEQIKYLTVHDVEDRLFNFFHQHYGQSKTFECDLSKKDLAAAIAATPETLSRLLLRLTSEGKLKWEGRQVQIAICLK